MTEARARYRVRTAPEMTAALKANAKALTRGHRDATYSHETPGPDLVKALCSSQGWTQVDVATMLNVNVSTVRRWMADLDQPQASKIPYAEWSLLLIMSGHVRVDDVKPAADHAA